MISAIYETLLMSMETTTKMNQYDTNLTRYTYVSCGIINEVLQCKNMSKKLNSLQT